MGKNKKAKRDKGKPAKVRKVKQNKKVKRRHTWKSVRQKQKQSHGVDIDTIETTPKNEPKKISSIESLKPQEKASLRSRMLHRLSVARFRTLNESIDSNPVTSIPSSLTNPSTFKAYHEGLQAASSSWKTNPLDNIVEWIKGTQGSKKIVADFGCGDASLSKMIPNETHSFDLHSLDPCVTACDMRNVPLEDGSVDIVVFCLSLMGSEVGDFIREAWRVLKLNGVMKIAEVRGRIGNLGRFVKQVEGIGFKRMGSVDELDGGVFCISAFRKIAGRRNQQGGSVELKSVVYKKR